MTPGEYLRRRREAAGLSIDELALMTETAPPVCARRRADYLRAIEDGTMKLGAGTALVLAGASQEGVFPFDPRVLATLVAIDEGAAVDAPRVCRVCACSWQDPCVDETNGAACLWVKGDALCTRDACLIAAAEAGFVPQLRALRSAIDGDAA